MRARVPVVLWLVVFVTVASGCRRGTGPIIDTTPGPDVQRGTIAGTLQKPGGGGAVAGRGVAAVHVESGRRYEAITNPAGGFTLQVPPATYRLEVQLLEGERLQDDPGPLTVGPSEIKANLRLTVGPPSP